MMQDILQLKELFFLEIELMKYNGLPLSLNYIITKANIINDRLYLTLNRFSLWIKKKRKTMFCAFSKN